MHSNLVMGSDTAELIFYLPTPPKLPENWQATHADAISQLIDLNGNHWRKIVTIMAKICCLDISVNHTTAWKTVREQLFFDAKHAVSTGAYRPSVPRLTCQIQIVTANIAPVTLSSGQWHIVCGKETQQRLGLNTHLGKAIDSDHKITHQQTCLLTPYLDYRQYSNALIELTKQTLSRVGSLTN
ncbi:hypothetical protein L2703_18565 [Shewanella basaltis]|uniref:DUF6942 family protein n=1 Tax=Shewanella basaltis TaxID=472183 RepID=UPI0020100DAB|nr:hypothetical protein [Shewanella basaltis]MCL1115569.1 hypothetical protein [Shewanella basaltis]